MPELKISWRWPFSITTLTAIIFFGRCKKKAKKGLKKVQDESPQFLITNQRHPLIKRAFKKKIILSMFVKMKLVLLTIIDF